MSTLIERHIVSLLAEKDDKAISLLYENYGDTLFGVAYKVVKDEDLAQDVLQESFIKIWKKADKEVQIDASNVYKVGVKGIVPDHMDIQDNLDKIDPKYRIVLEALFFEGMTQQEASEELDIPLGTIKSRLKIGLRELGKIYGTTMSLLLILNLLS